MERMVAKCAALVLLQGNITPSASREGLGFRATNRHVRSPLNAVMNG